MTHRPNILFISTDQQSYNARSGSGNPYVYTPNMDRLANEGIEFRRCYASNPVCGPARTTWMTGLYSSEHGVPFNGGNLHEHIPDLGQLLNRHGYYAAHCGKWHVEGRDPIKSFNTHYYGQRQIGAGGAEIYDHAVSHAAISFLLDYAEDKPFYLQVNYMNPHDICEHLHAHEYAARPDPVEAAILSERELPPLPENFTSDFQETITQIVCRREDDALIHRNILRAVRRWGTNQWRSYIWHYYRYVEKVDREIGYLLRVLEQSPFKENTLIVFTSDHGEACASHRMFQKFTVYEESVRVPLLVSSLGDRLSVSKGKADNRHLISDVDYMSTILDYAGIEPPGHAHGYSLRPLIEGKKVADWRRNVYVENNYYERALIQERYKYVTEYVPGLGPQDWVRPPNSARNAMGRELLFDLAEDPGETKNIADEQPVIVRQFRDGLSAHERSLDQPPLSGENARRTAIDWSTRIARFRQPI